MPQPATDPALKAVIDWWAEMGVVADPALLKALTPAKPSKHPPGSQPAPPKKRKGAASVADHVETARQLAASCDTIEALKAAIESFDGCPLKAGARNTVVFDGVPGAGLMVIGEGPGADEDRTGLPFVGRAGQLLDSMLAAIGRSRSENTLITNVNYWRPPKNRNPEPDELAVCRPFVDRMIVLAKPKLIMAAGAVPAKALLGTSDGIMKLRGKRFDYTPPGASAIALYPVLHPAYLLRRPQEKSRAWRDLLTIEAALGDGN
ncbi:MAG: uracil-DNA glycosylase [Pseudomonadota bacterium]